VSREENREELFIIQIVSSGSIYLISFIFAALVCCFNMVFRSSVSDHEDAAGAKHEIDEMEARRKQEEEEIARLAAEIEAKKLRDAEETSRYGLVVVVVCCLLRGRLIAHLTYLIHCLVETRGKC
jgi:hypothetical protein